MGIIGSTGNRALGAFHKFTESKPSRFGKHIRTKLLDAPDGKPGEKMMSLVPTSNALRTLIVGVSFYGAGVIFGPTTVDEGTPERQERIEGALNPVGWGVQQAADIIKDTGVGTANVVKDIACFGGWCDDASDRVKIAQDALITGTTSTTINQNNDQIIIGQDQIVIGGQENGAAPTTTTEALGAPDANAAVIIGNIACAGPSMDISMEGFGSPSQAILSASPAMEGHPDRYDIVDYAMNLPVNTGLVPEAMRQEDVIKGVPTNCASQ